MPEWFLNLAVVYVLVAIGLTVRMATSSSITTIEHSGWWLFFITLPSSLATSALAVFMGNAYDRSGIGYVVFPVAACLNVALSYFVLSVAGRWNVSAPSGE